MPFKGVFQAPKHVPSPFGLFSVADVINHGAGDEHWAGGYGVDSETCNVEGVVLDICGAPELDPFAEPSDVDYLNKIRPFGIRASMECLTPGFAVNDMKAKIMRQLDALTQKGVEAELWNGTFSISLDELAPPNMYLTSDQVIDVTGGAFSESGTAVKPKVGMALLEQALSECGTGSVNVIHMPASVASVLGGEISTHEIDGTSRLTSNAGNYIAVGNGYDGRGPAETEKPDTWFTPWIFATGPVAVHLGPKELLTPDYSSAVDSKTNMMAFAASRPASVFWDGCCHFGVQVDIRL